jgi:hypothetical protein
LIRVGCPIRQIPRDYVGGQAGAQRRLLSDERGYRVGRRVGAGEGERYGASAEGDGGAGACRPISRLAVSSFPDRWPRVVRLGVERGVKWFVPEASLPRSFAL